MEIKKMYLQTLMEDKGRLSEIELGESLGLNTDETSKIISRLLDEHKIEYVVYGACNYRPIKTKSK